MLTFHLSDKPICCLLISCFQQVSVPNNPNSLNWPCLHSQEYTDSKKVLIHEILFVSMVTVEVKSSDFHFCKKEYSFVCATVQFDLIFLSSAWYKNALNTPGVNYHFCRIKSLKWRSDFLQQIIFPNCPTLNWIKHFGCQFAKQFGKFGRFRYKN